MSNKGFDFYMEQKGIEKLHFDWIRTQRKIARGVVPAVLARLRQEAPVADSSIKPDAGRFRDSIGFRLYTTRIMKLSFVSTTPYADYIIHGTKGGTIINPDSNKDTLSLRWMGGDGNFVFSRGNIVRGDTPANKFNERVAVQMTPLIRAAFQDAIVVIGVG